MDLFTIDTEGSAFEEENDFEFASIIADDGTVVRKQVESADEEEKSEDENDGDNSEEIDLEDQGNVVDLEDSDIEDEENVDDMEDREVEDEENVDDTEDSEVEDEENFDDMDDSEVEDEENDYLDSEEESEENVEKEAEQESEELKANKEENIEKIVESYVESSDEEEVVLASKKFQLFVEEPRKCPRAVVRPKKNVFDFKDVYINFDMDAFGESSATATLQKERRSAVDELLSTKSIAHQPGFNQLNSLPHSDVSKKKARQLRKVEQEKTKGGKWFNMPATEITEEVKRDLEVLQMRSVLDPKTFYKKNDLKVLPKYFQIGRVVDNAADFYHSRIPKKDRKRTMVDELLADAEFQHRSKQKYKEIVAEKQQFHSKAHRQANRLKRKKKQ